MVFSDSGVGFFDFVDSRIWIPSISFHSHLGPKRGRTGARNGTAEVDPGASDLRTGSIQSVKTSESGWTPMDTCSSSIFNR